MEEPPPRARIGLLGLLVIAFFWVNGGCYGNEALFEAGPPAIVFACLIIIPFVYSLPISLITLELTTALPLDGGLVAWVEEAFGMAIGGHNTYWIFVGYAVDAAIYPILAGEYLAQFVDDSVPLSAATTVSLIASAVVILVLATKLLGTDILVNLNALLAVASLLPAILFCAIGLKDVKGSQLIETHRDGGTNYSLLASWQVWLYSGFLGLGALAGEVDNPNKTLVRVIIILIPVVILVNALPLIVSLGIDSDLSNYQAGYFDDLARDLSGDWLGWFFVVGAQLVMIGLHNAQSMVCERVMSQFFQARFPRMKSQALVQRYPKYRWFFDESTHGVGPAYIIFNSLLNLCLAWLPYALLVEFGMLLLSFAMTLFLAAFVQLRRSRPDMTRPYKIPGGSVGVAIAVGPPLAISAVTAYFNLADDNPVLGVKYLKIYCVLFIMFAGFAAHGIYLLLTRSGPALNEGETQALLLKGNGKGKQFDNPLFGLENGEKGNSTDETALHLDAVQEDQGRSLV